MLLTADVTVAVWYVVVATAAATPTATAEITKGKKEREKETLVYRWKNPSRRQPGCSYCTVPDGTEGQHNERTKERKNTMIIVDNL